MSETVPAYYPPPLSHSSSHANFRRSISIFSRKGSETPIVPVGPVPVVPTLDESTSLRSKHSFSSARQPTLNSRPSVSTLSATSLRSKQSAATLVPTLREPKPNMWRLAKVPIEEKPPQGTILRAVPKEPRGFGGPSELSLSSLSDTITQTTTADDTFQGYQAPRSSTVCYSPASDLNTRTIGSNKQIQKEQRNSNVIGVWRDGKAQWRTRVWSEGTNESSTTVNSKKTSKPKIQVVIPNNRPSPPMPFFANQEGASAYGITKTTTISIKHSDPRSLPSHSMPVTKTTTVRVRSDAEPISAVSPPVRRPMSVSVAPSVPTIEEVVTPAASKPAGTVISSESSSSALDDENSSQYSNRSSMSSATSTETHDHTHRKEASIQRRNKKRTDESTIVSPISEVAAFEIPTDMGTPQHPAELYGSPVLYTRSVDSSPAAPVLKQRSSRKRMSSRRGHKRMASLELKTIPSSSSLRPSSPTLSEAEKDLEDSLTAIGDDRDFSALKGASSENVPAGLTPPPKSHRRSLIGRSPPQMSTVPEVPKPEEPHYHRASLEQVSRMSLGEDADWRTGAAMSARGKAKSKVIAHMERNISAQAAEAVILHILKSLESFQDLFATAVLNKGFYRVFKRHELHLLKAMLKSASPPAWEFREASLAAINDGGSTPNEETPQPDYMPASYLQCHTRDSYIIDALKGLILQHCKSFLRVSTVAALASSDPAASVRVDAAFWRIWTFCTIFGGARGREDDIMAQMDWLRGGVLVHQASCTSTIVSSDSFYMSGVLLSAPDHFAMGNNTPNGEASGLSAEELYDITELWGCMSVLIQSLEENTDLARMYGVYDSTEVRGGDIDGEEAMLEEWQSYILTLGLSALLDLAQSATSKNPTAAFQTAAQNGWTTWQPPRHGGSRSIFLKEAASRVYEEKIAAAFSTVQQNRQEMKEINRQRAASHAAELRLRKQEGQGANWETISMSNDRPMSEWSAVMNTLGSPVAAQNQPAGLIHPALRGSISSTRRPTTASTDTNVQVPRNPYAQKPLPASPGSSVSSLSTPTHGSTPHTNDLPSATSPFSPAITLTPATGMFPHGVVSPQTSQQFQSIQSVPQEYHHEHQQRYMYQQAPAVPMQTLTMQHQQAAQQSFFQPSHRRNSSGGSSSVSRPVTSHGPTQLQQQQRTPPRTPSPHLNYPGPPSTMPPSPHRVQHPLQTAMSSDADPATNSADRAVFRIVEMGFTAEEARRALMCTDMGDGLRVDRAVELLLRRE
ncbi:hypothetical protein K402DRAFT_416690 [Aulographum hederae CBS 113979]|uniref:UBA domain-containing protein n=1 Tax=Aulographum hederae CBS 113979 TaxID=1176131 RepID=A0A6G1HDY3_9PEZI|nr:hypothetical protein K402DRAFT_416690 [Aulographum hederae CBS 113979]